jgi:hypothetical protein
MPSEETACITMLITRFCFQSLLIPSSNLKHPRYPILQNPQLMFLPPREAPRLIPIQDNMQNYSFVYYKLYIFIQHIGRQQFWTEWQQKFLKFNLLCTSLHSTSIHFIHKCSLVCQSCAKISELCHILKGFITHPYDHIVV